MFFACIIHSNRPVRKQVLSLLGSKDRIFVGCNNNYSLVSIYVVYFDCD